MITIRPGSHVEKLILLLSVVGEYPVYSCDLLGSRRSWRRLIDELTQRQEFRFPELETRYTCRLLKIRGKGRMKTVRFQRAGLPVLKQLNPGAYQYYMDSFYQHQIPGNARTIERHHRVAESTLMCLRAGVEARPLRLPTLQNEKIMKIVLDRASFYHAREVKQLDPAELNKTCFSSMTGLLFYPGGCYAVYNSRYTKMQWNGMGENKVRINAQTVTKMNAGIGELRSAIQFGMDYSTALGTIEDAVQNKRRANPFHEIYYHFHFVPLNEFGIRLLRILTFPDGNEQMLNLLFRPTERFYNQGLREYDARVNGVYVFSHLDGDLARLMRFRDELRDSKGKTEVLCFTEQVPFLREYLGDRVSLKAIGMNLVEADLSPPWRKDLFEG